MFGAITGEQLSFFVIVLVAFALLATEKIRNDLVAVLLALSLVGSRILTPQEALAGFSSEPAIVVASVFVLSAALHATGVSEALGHRIGRLAGGGYARAVAVIMASVAALSAFTHHVTMTAVMMPVTLDVARGRNIPASKLLIPLSFAASLGTTITIIGAPAFLIASAVLRDAGGPGLGIFSIAPIGVALSVLGIVYMVLVGRLLVPLRRSDDAKDERFGLDEYFTEIAVPDDSPFIDKTVDDVEADRRFRAKVVGVMRGGRHTRRDARDRKIRSGDVLLVRATPDDLVAFGKERGIELQPVHQYQTATATDEGDPDERGDDVHERFVQVIVAPGSDLAGRTLAELDFRRRFGAIVLGLWRQRGWLDQELSRIPLSAGDVLVVQGDDAALARIAADQRFLMMVPFQGQPRPRRKAPVAASIMIGTIVAASMHVPLEIAGITGAAAMVLTGCLTPRQAYQAIDARIFVFIAGAIPLGTAMKNSGSSELVAGWLEAVVGGWSPFLILLALYAVVAIVTEFMSDAATTALLAPLAAALAQGLGQRPEPFVVTVAMASVTAFLTPMAHHGNLIIYGPGGYRFGDFARVGAPLTVLIGLTVAFLSTVLWRG